MVSPVSGPYWSRETLPGRPNRFGYMPKWFWRERTWYRQRKPYTIRLPYSMQVFYIRNSANSYDFSQEYYNVHELGTGSDETRLYDKALARFQDEVRGAVAELGALLGESKSSLSMISTRATQLWNGFKAAKRGDVRGLKRLWGKHAGIRKRLRSAGGHVLEYSFGWAPLVSDIQGAIAATTQGLPKFRPVKGSSMRLRDEFRLDSDVSLSEKRTTTTKLSWVLRADVSVDNPNRLLAQQLGLTNLGSVLWELTPNSYILDYFVNVSDYIGSLTWSDGLVISNASATLMKETNVTSLMWWPPGSTEERAAPSWEGGAVTVRRVQGLPLMSLSLRPPWDLSASRASTSVARLLQLLKG